MTTDSSKKETALKLRLAGQSYGEITKQLSVPKSTLAYWLKGVSVSRRIKLDNIRKAKFVWSKNISEYNKTRAKLYIKNREKDLQKYSREVSKLSNQGLWWLGMGLYLGEGEKHEKHKIRFVNSDPVIILIIMKFFERCCGVKLDQFKARIQCYDNQDYAAIMKYWSQLTKITSNKFWKPQIVEAKNKSHKLKNGTLHLTISDSKLNLKIHGWMQGVRFQFMPM